MARKTLTDARIGALAPRNTAYDIRDGKLKGFGVRVTHAFHPLHGREFQLVEIKPTIGMEFVHYTGDDGVQRSIRRAWTSVACDDPYVRVGSTTAATHGPRRIS